MKPKQPDVVYQIRTNRETGRPIRKRVKGGTVERLTCVVNGIPLKGYMAVTRRNGGETKETVFGLEVMPGFDWHWLAAKNGRRFKKPAIAA